MSSRKPQLTLCESEPEFPGKQAGFSDGLLELVYTMSRNNSGVVVPLQQMQDELSHAVMPLLS